VQAVGSTGMKTVFNNNKFNETTYALAARISKTTYPSDFLALPDITQFIFSIDIANMKHLPVDVFTVYEVFTDIMSSRVESYSAAFKDISSAHMKTGWELSCKALGGVFGTAADNMKRWANT